MDDRNARAWAHDTTLVPKYRQLWWDAPEFVPIAIQRAREWAAAIKIQSTVCICIAKTTYCRLCVQRRIDDICLRQRLRRIREASAILIQSIFRMFNAGSTFLRLRVQKEIDTSASVANGGSITLLKLLICVQKERALDMDICQ